MDRPPTKTLLLMRHAKAGQKDGSVPDHDRPLTNRGRSDAPRMGRRLAELAMLPDRIVCSTARRAQETAEAFVEAIGFQGAVVDERRLYLAPPALILSVVAEIGGDAGRIMVIGHNPGLEQLLVELVGSERALPTAAIAQVELPITRWQAVGPGIRGKLVAFLAPKDEG